MFAIAAGHSFAHAAASSSVLRGCRATPARPVGPWAAPKARPNGPGHLAVGTLVLLTGSVLAHGANPGSPAWTVAAPWLLVVYCIGLRAEESLGAAGTVLVFALAAAFGPPVAQALSTPGAPPLALHGLGSGVLGLATTVLLRGRPGSVAVALGTIAGVLATL